MSDPQCVLPVIRKRYDAYNLHVEMCGEPLFVNTEETEYLTDEGRATGCGQTWRVECGNGHVLVVPDHEADDNFPAIPWDDTLVGFALIGIAYLSAGVTT